MLVDGLRWTFYGDTIDTVRRFTLGYVIVYLGNPPPALRSSKSQKGAKTHYAPAAYLKSFLARRRICTVLLDKVRRAPLATLYSAELLTVRRHAFVCAQFSSTHRPSHSHHSCSWYTAYSRSPCDSFLHLVTLTALIARLARLFSSLCRILSTVHLRCLHLLDDLHVRNEQPVTTTYTHSQVS